MGGPVLPLTRGLWRFAQSHSQIQMCALLGSSTLPVHEQGFSAEGPFDVPIPLSGRSCPLDSIQGEHRSPMAMYDISDGNYNAKSSYTP